MTNEELKKKIVEILEEYNLETDDGEGWVLDTEEMADALIAAGIGDVSEYKEKLKLHRVFVRKDGGDIKVLYGNNEVDEIVKERNEYKHRAEVAERALEKIATYCAIEDFDCFSLTRVAVEARAKELYNGWVQQAEKELQEEM